MDKVNLPEIQTIGAQVYLLGIEAGFYKIGCSYDIAGRLKQLQSGCPQEIHIIGTSTMVSNGPDTIRAYPLETMIHKRLAAYRSYGEWFKAPIEVIVDAWQFAIEEYFSKEEEERQRLACLEAHSANICAAAARFQLASRIENERERHLPEGVVFELYSDEQEIVIAALRGR